MKAQAAVKQGKAKSDQRINRRGGMKKFRGRLDLELRIQKVSGKDVESSPNTHQPPTSPESLVASTPS